MRLGDLSPAAPGELVPISSGLAFVPQLLPPEVAVSRQLLIAADSARGAIGELVGQARLLKNVDLISQPLMRREAVLSSRLEGTQTELVELLLQEATPSAPEENSDIHEVLNYVATVELAQEWLLEGRNLDLPMIKDLHSRLLLGVRGRDKRPGAFRSGNVFIGTRAGGFEGARFVPPPVEQITGLLQNLISFMRGSTTYGPLIDAAMVHYQFEAIHPFADGNGRLGRLLVPLQLVDRAVIDRPLLYLGPYFQEHEDEYRDGLLAVSTRGAWATWAEFFLQALESTATDALARVRRTLELRERYVARITAETASRAALLAIDVLFANVFVSVRTLTDELAITHVTAKAVLDSLTSLGILARHGRVGGRQMWKAAEILRDVYES